jgi:hypothetical protein
MQFNENRAVRPNSSDSVSTSIDERLVKQARTHSERTLEMTAEKVPHFPRFLIECIKMKFHHLSPKGIKIFLGNLPWNRFAIQQKP